MGLIKLRLIHKTLIVECLWLALSTSTHAAQECFIDRVNVRVTALATVSGYLPLNYDLGNKIRTTAQKTLARYCAIGDVIVDVNPESSSMRRSFGNNASIEVGVKQAQSSVGGYLNCVLATEDDRSVGVIKPIAHESASIYKVIIDNVNECLGFIPIFIDTLNLYNDP